MSSDNIDTRLGPAIQTNQVIRPNATYGSSPYDDYGTRSRDALASQQYNGQRNLYEALGYTREPDYRHFKARYDRGGTATALVDKPANDCWGERPEIVDTTDRDDEDGDTEFEDAVESFLRQGDKPWEGDADMADLTLGAHSKPLDVAESVDRMGRLGNFSLLFIGFNDDNADVDGDDEAEESGLAKPVDYGSLDGLDDVSYLSAYDQGRVDWATTQSEHLVEDVTDPRYGRPEHYLVELDGTGELTQIHYSRVIHNPGENPYDNDLISPSVLRRSLNRLDDLEKVFGGSAEAFWRSAYQGIVIQPPDSAMSPGTSLDEWGEQVHEQMDAWLHNLNRTLFSNGEVTTLDTNVADPQNHVDTYYREIAAGHDIPQSILMGNETGERATDEDRAMYHEFLGRRRRQHCEQAILRPLINRLIAFGVLPEPDGDGYDVEWPPLEEATELEEAETFDTWMAGFKKAAGGSPSRLLSDAEVRDFADLSPERGSEVEEPGAEAATADDLAVDEQDENVMEQFDQIQGPQPPGEAATDGGEDSIGSDD